MNVIARAYYLLRRICLHLYATIRRCLKQSPQNALELESSNCHQPSMLVRNYIATFKYIASRCIILQVTGKSHSGPRTDARREPCDEWRREEGLDWVITAIPEENYQLNHAQIVTGCVD